VVHLLGDRRDLERDLDRLVGGEAVGRRPESVSRELPRDFRSDGRFTSTLDADVTFTKEVRQ
jgi:hypothetical protein